ncbi:MAG: FAD-dependent oxidoreductase [Candidatus Hodarchaeales archaeon]
MITENVKSPNAIRYRSIAKDKLKSVHFDILVIGGGITGAGVARDAQLRGFSVALVEKSDFGQGTSSGSSKLVHAGLRYLAQKEFRLVREASVERKRMINMLPHLTREISVSTNFTGGRKHGKSCLTILEKKTSKVLVFITTGKWMMLESL